MHILRDYQFHWWQLSMLKVSTALIGVVIGALWPEFFRPWIGWLLAVAVVLAAYLCFVWIKKLPKAT
jgi:hypothetical protein